MITQTTLANDSDEVESSSGRELSRQSREVEYTTETITPEDAEAMISTSAEHYLDEKAIASYAEAISKNAWRENGQPIIFDEHGKLADGVQRLHAVIKAGKPIVTLVARNVRADTLHTIDQHRRRNYAGVLESRGIKDAGSVVRTMSKLIRIENGALNRNPISISWSRYDRVIEANPEILDAVAMAADLRGCELHSTPRPVLIFMAMRAGKLAEVRAFLRELTPEAREDGMTAATQARMRFSGWNNDPAQRVDVDKVLGNAILFFNAWCRNETLPPSKIWNPSLGRTRNADGKWVSAGSAIREDRVEGLRPHESRMILGDEPLEFETLEKIARKMLLRRNRKGDEDDDEDTRANDDRLSLRDFRDFLKNQNTLQKRLRQEAERRRLEEAAPPNLGLPMVDGYPGLREGQIDPAIRFDIAGPIPELTMRHNRRNQKGVHAFMTVVTPEMAEKWLSQRINSSNRKIQKSHVNAIARDIANDRWMVNAQPISFSADPFDPDVEHLRLLNGQHRLMAVVESGTPIEVPIAVNVPEEAFATFDVHTKKMPKTAAERVDDRVVNAAARFQWKEDVGIRPMDASTSPTASEIMDTIQKHPGLLESFPRSRRAGMTKLGTAGVLTYFFYRVSREAPDIAPQFLDDLEFGENLSAQNPVLGLREDMISDRGKITRREGLSKLISCWNAYKKWRRKTAESESQKKMDFDD